MPPHLLFDLSEFDLNALQHDVDYIESINPHRGAMRMLDGIIHVDDDFDRAVAFKDVRDDEFWVPGHIPDRPVFPGVLQLEAAAQASSFCSMHLMEEPGFLGFTAAEHVKFRGQVGPGVRLYILVKRVEVRRRRFISDTQGVVDGQQIFEARITGMPI